MKPLVSIIVPTYNRAHTLGRTLSSILAQTYDRFEIIVVDDGSTDDTTSLLQNFTDNRIRVIKHEVNKGVSAAKNTGLNNISGEWFTILDSDDEILPEALETMMNIPLEKDPAVTALLCNCTDTSTGEFSGKGLFENEYLDFKKWINATSGEFWGLNKTALLQNDRLNEQLRGFESVLWFKLNERSNIYYIHKALRIYHTEGVDRILKQTLSIKQRAADCAALVNEVHYLKSLEAYSPRTFVNKCLTSVMYLVANKEKGRARFFYDLLRKTKGFTVYKMGSFVFFHSNAFLATIGIKCLEILNIIG